LRPASNSSTRTAAAPACGYESGIKRRVRQQLTESAGGIEFIDENGGGPGVRLRHQKKS
jgi:truncated hemoglobin YjbI